MVSFIFKKVRTQLLPWPIRYLMCYHGFFLISIPIGGTRATFWNSFLNMVWHSRPEDSCSCSGFAFFYPKMAFMYQHKEVCVLSRCSWYIDSLFLEQQAFCFAQLMLYVPVRGDVWIYCSLVVWPAMYDLLPKCLKGFILYSLLLVLSNFLGGSWHSCYETVHHDLYIFSDILFCLALC